MRSMHSQFEVSSERLVEFVLHDIGCSVRRVQLYLYRIAVLCYIVQYISASSMESIRGPGRGPEVW
jgi:hypothetical protein